MPELSPAAWTSGDDKPIRDCKSHVSLYLMPWHRGENKGWGWRCVTAYVDRWHQPSNDFLARIYLMRFRFNRWLIFAHSMVPRNGSCDGCRNCELPSSGIFGNQGTRHREAKERTETITSSCAHRCVQRLRLRVKVQIELKNSFCRVE